MKLPTYSMVVVVRATMMPHPSQVESMETEATIWGVVRANLVRCLWVRDDYKILNFTLK